MQFHSLQQDTVNSRLSEQPGGDMDFIQFIGSLDNPEGRSHSVRGWPPTCLERVIVLLLFLAGGSLLQYLDLHIVQIPSWSPSIRYMRSCCRGQVFHAGGQGRDSDNAEVWITGFQRNRNTPYIYSCGILTSGSIMGYGRSQILPFRTLQLGEGWLTAMICQLGFSTQTS